MKHSVLPPGHLPNNACYVFQPSATRPAFRDFPGIRVDPLQVAAIILYLHGNLISVEPPSVFLSGNTSPILIVLHII